VHLGCQCFNAGRGNKNNREPDSFSVADAEQLTGMKHQRVADAGGKGLPFTAAAAFAEVGCY
jgi:hypothetical protein